MRIMKAALQLERVGRGNGSVGHLCCVVVRYVGVVMVGKDKRKREGDTDVKSGIARRPAPHRISCTHVRPARRGRYINKQHAKTSAVHILATRLKLHQTVFFFFQDAHRLLGSANKHKRTASFTLIKLYELIPTCIHVNATLP